MKEIKFLINQNEFQKEFERCCKEYTEVIIFTAWVGSPGNIIPYGYLDNLKKVEFFLGISFDQSSPEGIEYLLNKKFKVTIVDEASTYHPKLYFFKSNQNAALLMGSSNFTYSGFFENTEANVLLEGASVKKQINDYLAKAKLYVSNLNSFSPNKKWLSDYQIKYKNRLANIKQTKLKDETDKEEKLILYSSWLSKADWNTYIKHIKKGLKNHSDEYNEPFERKLELFKEFELKLKTPWTILLLKDIANRRMILGNNEYGWLGHIGASGRIQQLLSNGTEREKMVIITTINKIAEFKYPINYILLQQELSKLNKLGPSVKVWGRMLAITRPDIFCTISSNYVRESLSQLLQKPKSYFESIEGYIELLKLIHNSPWFNSKKPQNKMELEIWNRRVAFLDVIFY